MFAKLACAVVYLMSKSMSITIASDSRGTDGVLEPYSSKGIGVPGVDWIRRRRNSGVARFIYKKKGPQRAFLRFLFLGISPSAGCQAASANNSSLAVILVCFCGRVVATLTAFTLPCCPFAYLSRNRSCVGPIIKTQSRDPKERWLR